MEGSDLNSVKFLIVITKTRKLGKFLLKPQTIISFGKSEIEQVLFLIRLNILSYLYYNSVRAFSIGDTQMKSAWVIE